jgi:hypothetical protein
MGTGTWVWVPVFMRIKGRFFDPPTCNPYGVAKGKRLKKNVKYARIFGKKKAQNAFFLFFVWSCQKKAVTLQPENVYECKRHENEQGIKKIRYKNETPFTTCAIHAWHCCHSMGIQFPFSVRRRQHAGHSGQHRLVQFL